MAPLHAGWALWGKHPGSNADYAVLSSSQEPLTQPEFASVLTHFTPGTPPTGDNQPGSLPWVVISRVGIEDRPYVGMAIQKPSGQVDGSGRPFTLTSYFCLPYAELAEAQVTYAGLYGVLDSIQLPWTGDGLIPLDVPRLEPSALADEVRNFGEEQVAATAALMLSGQVSVIGSEGSSAADRLRYLDALAALLPYGYRSDLTAATWSDNAARPQIRLSFGARAREGSGVARWQSPAPGELRHDDPGGSYLRLLREIRARGEARRESQQLVKLIKHLARDRAPELFDQPRRAAGSLSSFDLPFIVADAVRNRAARPDEMRAVFDQSRVTDLPDQDRAAVLAALIEVGDPQDLPRARAWWEASVASNPASVLPALALVTRRLLWAREPDHLGAKEYLDLAADHGLLDDLLSELVREPGDRGERLGGLGAVAQVLAVRVVSNRDASFPAAQRAMAGSQLVACELLAQLAGFPAEAHWALTWLEPALGGFLQPFRIVLGDVHGTVDQAALRQLGASGTARIQILLQTASTAGRLGAVLPGFASWLALRRLDQPTAAQNGAWYEVAWALTARDASSSAWLDLVLLLTGSDARFLLVVLDQAGRDDYNSSLARSWAELAANVGQAADDLLAEGLIAYLGRKHWTDDALQTDAVVGLAGLLTSDGQRPRLVSAVADALTASPMAASRPAAQDWLARVRPPAPGAGQGDVLDLLRGMAPGAEIPRLAGLCTQGFQQGVDANAICQVLIDGGLIRSGVEAMDFLSWLRVGNYVSDLDLQAEGDWLVWFHIRFADGSFGPRVTSEFRHIAISAAERDITIAVNMVYILATKGQRDASPDLTDEEIDQLSWIPKSIEQILKDARKRRPKLRSGRHGRNEPEPGPVPDGPRTEPPPLEVTRGTAAQAGDHPHG